jgi:cytoskeletal protein CcmA (bactofilin family)
MAVKYTRKVIFPLLLLAIVFLSSGARASVFKKSGRYFVPVGDTINDDVALLTGESVINGVITNDLYIGSREYIVSGEVNGSLNSFSQNAAIRGIIGNTANIFAYELTVDGQIENNLTAFAYKIELSHGSRVGKDAFLMGAEVSVTGEIARNLNINGDHVVISGKIGGDLNIKGGRISITAPAEILGDIKYKSSREIKIDDGVVIHGIVNWKKITPKEDKEEAGTGWPFRIILFLCALITGLIIIPLFNQHTRAAAGEIIKKPLVTLGIGFVSFSVAPFAIIILMLTIIGIPSAIILLFIFAIFFYIAKVYVSIALGRLIVRAFRKGVEPKQGWSLILGLIILMLLFTIPVIGWIIYFGVIFFGFGAIIMGYRKLGTEMPQSGPQPT